MVRARESSTLHSNGKGGPGMCDTVPVGALHGVQGGTPMVGRSMG
jgi:hypothetical protein